MENSNGRLLRNHGALRRLLDHVQRGLIALGLTLSLVPQAHAAGDGQTTPYAQAYADCQAADAQYSSIVPWNGYTDLGCLFNPGDAGHKENRWYLTFANGSSKFTLYQSAIVTPPTAQETCSGRPEIVAASGSSTTYSNAGCVYAPYGDTNHTVCIDESGEHYCTGEIHFRPTGGTTLSSPPVAADPVPPPPKACGGGSCYDPSQGKYCAVAGGSQVCVSAGPSNPSGGCASSGDTTLCAGTPAPLPPTSSVYDPATQIGSSDHYHESTGSASSVVTVNNYNTSGGSPQSGQGDGDVGPPSDDGSTPDKSTASGGGDCGSPPVVSGDEALAMIARQQWLTRCQGDGGSSNDADTAVPGLDGIADGPGAGFFTESSIGLDKLDASGFGGGGTCPKFPTIRVESLGFVYDTQPSGWCEILAAVGKVVMLLGAFFALRILTSK